MSAVRLVHAPHWYILLPECGIANDEIDIGYGNDHDHTRKADHEKIAECDGVAFGFRFARHHNVGARPDKSAVAAKARTKDERPSERLNAQAVDLR